MSSQKGNVQRSRPQKHQNEFAFKNNMHDTSQKKKQLNNLELPLLCDSCKGKIEWRIKFNKYTPLSKPARCVKCDERNVKRSYYTCCDPCAQKLHICAKCLESKEIVKELELKTQSQVDQEFAKVMKKLPERRRRTIIRLMKSGVSYYDEKIQTIISRSKEKSARGPNDLSNSEESDSEYSDDSDQSLDEEND
ncbi:hypothetical protein Ciccas_006111 [Cichlidogyrus casuarinus]|uniref:Uncharacterized protein n=1 Tax=Cichlidogyrus casuarinus TaxID=1844966 RepID=A0ABD2QAI9_9PLAT